MDTSLSKFVANIIAIIPYCDAALMQQVHYNAHTPFYYCDIISIVFWCTCVIVKCTENDA